jgi:hypothetical protein
LRTKTEVLIPPVIPEQKIIVPAQKAESVLPPKAPIIESKLPSQSTPALASSVIHGTQGDSPKSFDFSRFIEHIRSVPKRSFVGL